MISRIFEHSISWTKVNFGMAKIYYHRNWILNRQTPARQRFVVGWFSISHSIIWAQPNGNKAKLNALIDTGLFIYLFFRSKKINQPTNRRKNIANFQHGTNLGKSSLLDIVVCMQIWPNLNCGLDLVLKHTFALNFSQPKNDDSKKEKNNSIVFFHLTEFQYFQQNINPIRFFFLSLAKLSFGIYWVFFVFAQNLLLKSNLRFQFNHCNVHSK